MEPRPHDPSPGEGLHEEVAETVRAARDRLRESREVLAKIRERNQHLREEHEQILADLPARSGDAP